MLLICVVFVLVWAAKSGLAKAKPEIGDFLLPVSKFDAELLPRSKDILPGVETNMAK